MATEDRRSPLKVAVAGPDGRMGRSVVHLLGGRDGMSFVGALRRADAEATREAILAQAEVVIDFTSAAASAELARLCAERGGPALVVGSTGWTDGEEAVLRTASALVAIVRAGNFSLGVNLLLGLVRRAAGALGREDYDIEVLEAHHRRKRDAPSGTALMLGEAAAAGRGSSLAALAAGPREGSLQERLSGTIGFASLRGGGVIGEHSVIFAAEDEVLTLSHSALDRSLFARGALEAAQWVAGRPAGLYDMQDVLDLSPTA